MESTAYRAIAIVGTGAILPDAPNVPAFWENIKKGRYSITEVEPERWDPALYYDPDPSAPDKTYSKIGGWVREYVWDPMKWRFPVPPRVVDAMDGAQKWAIASTREALEDYGYPKRPLDSNRTAVILGNAMAGEKHYLTALRIYFPEYSRELSEVAGFAGLPEAVRKAITRDLHDRITKLFPEITEDSMPGELANCIAGRIANIFNFHGPNYVCDAACASAMAAISSAVEGLVEKDFDAVITGGIDRNMGASTFVKFCKIGALSATGTRPYAEGADGFVMGEGAAIFLLKRLADAERDGDKIYAVLRGIGGSSDGKGKGITAPNPLGQKLAIERAWQNAGLSPATVTYIEGHGTSTRVGDVVEVQSMVDVLSGSHLPAHSVALGSVKSNFGHLKGAAGAAGLLKTALSLRDKVLPPSVHCEHPNHEIDFAHAPLYVNAELRPWAVPSDGVRRAGLSAFGFGGTNFHAVLEEYIPHRLNGSGKQAVTVGQIPSEMKETVMIAKDTLSSSPSSYKTPLRGALLMGAVTESVLVERLRAVEKSARAGHAPAPAVPMEADLRAPQRLAIDYANAAELAEKATSALKALAAEQPAVWKALRAQGIFRGHGPAPKVAFLYPGQGSQYVNMLKPLLATDPIVAETFAEADRVMTPILGKRLSDFIFVNHTDAEAVAKAENDLRQTAITQPAVLASDLALTRLLKAYGIEPDFAMGHSLGEYAALVAASAVPFADALEAVSARGREMTRFSPNDKGRMAAVFAPLEKIEEALKTINGYVVIANINSERQSVIGGASKAVEQATEALLKAGYEVTPLQVSHAFHTSIVAAASEPLRRVLARLHLQSPCLPVVANTNGEFYPTGTNVVPQMLDILAQQVASPVQFIKGLRTLYDAGARMFVEVGPKKALQGFAEDVLGSFGDAISVFTNHPKVGDIPAFNQALCCLYAAGLGRATTEPTLEPVFVPMASTATKPISVAALAPSIPAVSPAPVNGDHYIELGRMFAEAIERGWRITHGEDRPPTTLPVTITGAALGLPGTERIFDDTNMGRLLRGDQFIDSIPTRFRHAMLDKHVTRLVKNDSGGTFETISNVADVIKLAGRGGTFDLEKEFGVSPDRRASLDRVTQLAIGVGLDALRDAGIPLVMRYKTTSKGTQLPDRWALPETLRDDTGVIFASAFPGLDSFAHEMSQYYADRARREQLATLQGLRARAAEANGDSILAQEIDRRIEELCDVIEKQPYVFDRRYLFRVLSMGHSQFAEFIGARGPNTQINSACASTTQAVTLAEDWIRSGRCRRVIVVSADDVTTDNLIDWMGAGFLASGAAATDDVVEEAATPFDRRRHGMIIGMGAAGFVIESAEAARERGIQPICEVLGAVTANSAFHGTRLDIQHISQVMEDLVARAERLSGIQRHQIAPRTVFVSHETYTPARGGSAAAEIYALRHVFGNAADQIVIANTKGFTGHAMGAGVEDVLAVKALETGVVPPVANFKEVDPELGVLNLSKGGAYPVEYALRLGAGFGSQISMTLLHWIKTKNGVRRNPNALGYEYRIADTVLWNSWLSRIAGGSSPDLEVVCRTLRVRDARPSMQIETAPELRLTTAPSRAPQATPPPPVIIANPPAVSPVVVRETAERQPNVTAAAPAPPAAPEVDADGDSVKERILALVVEKTGYPKDMLDLDLDLEADLGVDTVKQAEMFAAIREIYNIPRDENRKLRDYPTLAHVIRFVYEKRPDLTTAASPSMMSAPQQEVEPSKPASAVISPKDSSGDPVKERILALVLEKTGYPKDMLDLDLDLEADLGVDTVKQAEMFAAIREIYNIPRDENRKLRDYPTLAHVIRFVYEKRPDLTSAAPPVFVVAKEETKPSTPASAKIPAATADDPVKEKILALVAEKTGYPKDMLDLDLDLEADLGIDTVKQAEMLAAVRGAYNIPRDENLKLRDFPTLAHVIQFARDRSGLGAAVSATPTPGPVQKPAISPSPSSAATQTKAPRPALASLDAANSIPRRVPLPILRPPLNICKPTGVTLGPGRRVVVVTDIGGVGDSLAQLLETKGVEVLRINGTAESSDLTDHLKHWMAAGPVHGIYWLPALDSEGCISEMDFVTWRGAVRVRVKSFYATMRILYEQIAAPGTFLVSGTRLGGQHGYDAAGAVAPLGGAVVGFAKTYKRERKDVLVKAIDFETGCSTRAAAELLIEETLRDPGAVEIGHKAGLRWTVGLQDQSAADGHPGFTLNEKTVFVITGAAGSIVSAITADLAAASGGTFYLLDLVPEPNPIDPDLKRLASDKEGLKRDLFARIQARGERATPALVEKELAALERAQAAQVAIDSVRAAGGTAQYFSVNLTDLEGVAKVIKEVRERHGRIDVLLHAAGIDRSRSLRDKDPHEFDVVFDVKSDGFFNLLHAIGNMPLGATVAFSSIAGRFGNPGQTDYSAANDLLCKITSSFRTTRPATRGIAIDWTAWGGIGMATRGSIPKVMEMAGIDMLPPEAGVPLIRRELTAGGTRGEIVIAQRLGILLNEWDETGGLDTSAAEISGERRSPTQGPVVGRISRAGVLRPSTFEISLDPKVQPFLYDHQIDGTPVLPGVMGIEVFAEAAASMLPDWHVEGIEEVDFLVPFKFYRNEPRTLAVETVIRPQGDGLAADCRLIGRRSLPNQSDLQVTTHFTGRVRLTKHPRKTMTKPPRGPEAGTIVEAADIYRLYFHGPAYQVLERAWWKGEQIVGLMAQRLPPNHYPANLPTLLTPRLIELCFQTAGIWEMGVQGRMGLPQRIDHVSLFRTPELAEGRLYAVVTPDPERGRFDAEVVDSAGNCYLQLTGYRTVAVPNAFNAERLQRLQALIAAEAVAAA
jgi:acyl transferase domain-containing protein/NAD(P)-dependent dehydrogenase (short-subunit alcohol dehydrogenase family)